MKIKDLIETLFVFFASNTEAEVDGHDIDEMYCIGPHRDRMTANDIAFVEARGWHWNSIKERWET